MQEPANMPLEVIRQELEMKQESTTFQFHNIWWGDGCQHLAFVVVALESLLCSRTLTEILQPPPISISIAAADEVDADAPAVAVPIAISMTVEEAWLISILIVVLGWLRFENGELGREMATTSVCHLE